MRHSIYSPARMLFKILKKWPPKMLKLFMRFGLNIFGLHGYSSNNNLTYNSINH